MIDRDRELLARMATVNRTLGGVAVELMARQDGGELPAEELHEVGIALRNLADDLVGRAADLRGHTLHRTTEEPR
ncbi:hypothetical protein [Saccharomonospora iraqiensis]|uniref:hypothetical protein n=1 Tax=Saccharomonospora iraqiensis TaxID=52698 RepID=UPI00022E53A3|nr:hypothetical protein [Saccharomonospora iraqiensis]